MDLSQKILFLLASLVLPAVWGVLVIWSCCLFLGAGLSWKELTSSLQGEAIFFGLRDLMYALGAASLLGAVSSYFAVNKLLKDMET